MPQAQLRLVLPLLRVSREPYLAGAEELICARLYVLGGAARVPENCGNAWQRCAMKARRMPESAQALS